ncbi:hypothetical protein GGR58DRAFT_495482 [Xylaria digitata]|nr:hypothetical protein GGR58DRAFT_495482 [Xylaria digitata]
MRSRLPLKDGLKLLKTELYRILKLGEDFGVLFCGGSFCNPGLQNVVKAMMTELRTEGEKLNISVTHSFLQKEYYWSSAVAIGAGLSMMRVPTASSLLASSRIGIHEISRPQRGRALWEGSDYAAALWRKNVSRDVDIVIPPGANRWLKFFLVCGPNYITRGPNSNEDQSQIRIAPYGGPIGASPVPYDLGWTIEPQNLPEGTIRFSIEVGRIGDLELNMPVQLKLKCYRVSLMGVATKEPNDKRYEIMLKTDPISKLLQVAEVKEYPLWCERRKAELFEPTVDSHNCRMNSHLRGG